MSREEIVAMFDRRRDAMNRHDVDALAADYCEDCTLFSPMAGNVVGRDAVRQVFRAWFAAFPDVTSRLDSELVIDGDHVAYTELMSGTDTGGFMGLPPTQKSFEFPVARVFTLKDGQITQERRVYDFTGMLVQIGVLKARPA
jgi:steroid delta-isomerase-like uncharacterized protein